MMYIPRSRHLAWLAWLVLFAALLLSLGPRARALPSGDDALHGPPGVACSHCHADPHGGAGGTTCQDCHGTERWTPTLFTVEQHLRTDFPLEGRHQRVDCGLCHVSTAPSVTPSIKAQLVGLPTECAGCHVDRHRGKLGASCQECHSPAGFVPLLISFDHQARTGFALTGPHTLSETEGLTCASCHQGENGRAMRIVATATCATCHTPTHADFTAWATDKGEDASCARCHTIDRATFADARFNHQRDTAFPLERRHAVLGCDDCHPAGDDAPDDRCQSCHLDAHSGQLGTSCSDCHRPDRWRLVRFDHDRTLFALKGRHFVTPCASCHTSQRWIGLRTDCFDCHALDLNRAPASVPAHRQGLADCGACHQPWTWTL